MLEFAIGDRVLVIGARTGHRGRRGTVRPRTSWQTAVTKRAIFVLVDGLPSRSVAFNDFELTPLSVVDLIAELA